MSIFLAIDHLKGILLAMAQVCLGMARLSLAMIHLNLAMVKTVTMTMYMTEQA